MAAGSARIAVAVEDSYGELPDTPTWREWFVGHEDPNPSLDQQLNREALAKADTPKTPKSAEGNLQGTVTLGGTMVNDAFHAAVFPENGNTELYDAGDQEWPSFTVYLSADVPGVSQETFLQGVFPTGGQVQYEQGQEVSVNLDCNFKQWTTDLTSPEAIQEADEDNAFMWHGMTPERGADEIAECQSLTIELGNLARGRRNQSRYFTRAVVANYELGLQYDPIFTESDNLELGLGSVGATEVQDDIDQQDYTVTFVNGTGDTHEYSVDGVQVGQYSWAQLIGEEDMTEPIQGNAADISVSVT